MIQNIAARLFLIGSLSCTFCFAADPRTELLHDVDHPWTFTPNFKTREDWEKRAEQVRKQILVAEGLWPMPEKTPLNPVIQPYRPQTRVVQPTKGGEPRQREAQSGTMPWID